MKKTKTKWQPAMSSAWVTWAAIGYGQIVYALYVSNHSAPIGFVWGNPAATTFQVAGSFVEPWARRNGVRSRINDEIFKYYEAIETANGTKDGGMAFMKAQKYQQIPGTTIWYLKRPKHNGNTLVSR